MTFNDLYFYACPVGSFERTQRKFKIGDSTGRIPWLDHFKNDVQVEGTPQEPFSGVFYFCSSVSSNAKHKLSCFHRSTSCKRLCRWTNLHGIFKVP